MKTIPNLELHITHSCNLACESCSHYSNQRHRGFLALEEADAWMQSWNGRLRPVVFTLLGGEPSLHPHLTDFVTLARRHWPDALLRLVTNGFFVHRHPGLPAALKAARAELTLSIHHPGPEYQAKLLPNLHLLRQWAQQDGVRIVVLRSYLNWTRRYHGIGANMTPFHDGAPEQSWRHCPARLARQLYQGAIWKCAPIAYLPLQHAKYGLSSQWEPYLRYQPLPPDCTEAEFEAFFAQRAEACCSMCPAHPEKIALPLPLQASAPLVTMRR